MKFIVFYLQFINSLEGLGMFFSSAALIRRLRRYTATVALVGNTQINSIAVFNPCKICLQQPCLWRADFSAQRQASNFIELYLASLLILLESRSCQKQVTRYAEPPIMTT